MGGVRALWRLAIAELVNWRRDSLLLATNPPPPPQFERRCRQTGGGPVSIFRLDLKNCPPIAKVSGQDGMKNLRTLRHPHVLACLDSVQLETEYVIATGGLSAFARVELDWAGLG